MTKSTRERILRLLRDEGFKVKHICCIKEDDVRQSFVKRDKSNQAIILVGPRKQEKVLPGHLEMEIKRYLSNRMGRPYEDWRPPYGPWLFNSSKIDAPIRRQTVHAILRKAASHPAGVAGDEYQRAKTFESDFPSQRGAQERA